MILRTTWRLVSGSSARYTSVMLRPSLRIILYLPNCSKCMFARSWASRGAAPWAAAASQAACSRARIFRLVATGRPEGPAQPAGLPHLRLVLFRYYHVVFQRRLGRRANLYPSPAVILNRVAYQARCAVVLNQYSEARIVMNVIGQKHGLRSAF